MESKCFKSSSLSEIVQVDSDITSILNLGIRKKNKLMKWCKI